MSLDPLIKLHIRGHLHFAHGDHLEGTISQRVHATDIMHLIKHCSQSNQQSTRKSCVNMVIVVALMTSRYHHNQDQLPMFHMGRHTYQGCCIAFSHVYLVLGSTSIRCVIKSLAETKQINRVGDKIYFIIIIFLMIL